MSQIRLIDQSYSYAEPMIVETWVFRMHDLPPYLKALYGNEANNYLSALQFALQEVSNVPYFQINENISFTRLNYKFFFPRHSFKGFNGDQRLEIKFINFLAGDKSALEILDAWRRGKYDPVTHIGHFKKDLMTSASLILLAGDLEIMQQWDIFGLLIDDISIEYGSLSQELSGQIVMVNASFTYDYANLNVASIGKKEVEITANGFNAINTIQNNQPQQP